MNRIILFILSVLLIGCAFTNERDQYKQRFDRFYKILTQNEKSFFIAGDYKNFGESIDKRKTSDKSFSKNYMDLQRFEAIISFDGTETGRFFREIILREYERDNLYQLLSFLDASGQKAFAMNNEFESLFNNMYQSNRKFKEFVDNIKKNQCLYDYTSAEMISFFRNITFPQITNRELYYLLKIVNADNAGYKLFKQGKIEELSVLLENNLKNSGKLRSDFDALKERTGLSKLSTADLLEVYYKVVIKEMDPYSVSHTLAKFE